MTRVRRSPAAPAAHVSRRAGGRWRPVRRRRPVSITRAAPGLSEDLGGRMRGYWLLMGLRVACLASLAVVPRAWWWLCIALALVAPLLAVLVANAGREGGGATAAERAGQDVVTLDGGAGAAGGDGGAGGADGSGPAPGRRVPTYTVRPGEFLR